MGAAIWIGWVVVTLCVCWVIVKSELDDANKMIENEIKNRNQDGF